jgi:hypothetical protein
MLSGRDAVCSMEMLVGRVGHLFGSVAGQEADDVGDGPHRFVAPVRVYAVSGLHRTVDGVHHCGVGTVEFDQGPGERAVEGLSVQGFRLPRPRQHRPDARDRNDVGQPLVGDGVILDDGNVDPSVGPADPDDAALPQGGEEYAECGPDRTGVVERQRQWRRERRFVRSGRGLGCRGAAWAGCHGIE